VRYTDSISWAAPDQPLPMIRDPRVVFDHLFASRDAGRPQGAAHRGSQHPRLAEDCRSPACRKSLRRDRARLNDYLDDVREIERRIQKVEAHNASGEQRECRARRSACRTRSPSTSS